jgi:hypothetical protein
MFHVFFPFGKRWRSKSQRPWTYLANIGTCNSLQSANSKTVEKFAAEEDFICGCNEFYRNSCKRDDEGNDNGISPADPISNLTARERPNDLSNISGQLGALGCYGICIK